jgi:LruC domain-containing protein
MKTALRTGAVTLSALLATVGLTGFTTININNTERINWQYERTSVTPEDLKGDKVDLNFGDYESNPPGTAAGAAFDAKDGLPKDKTGVFSLNGTAAGMPGLHALLKETLAIVEKEPETAYPIATRTSDSNALKSVVPNDFAFLVSKALPERLNILDNPAFKPASDANANLIMKENEEATRVWATFVIEGAGHKNSFGYFIYNPNCAPKHRNQVRAFKPGETIASPAITGAGTYTQGNADTTRTYVEERDCEPGEGTTAEIIVLPNASQDAPLPRAGSAKLGTSGTGPTAYLGEIPAGMAMGFVIVANGWTQTGNKDNQPGASKTQSTQWIFYSLSDLNPEPRGVRTVGTRTYDDLTKHVILLKDGNLENFETGYHRFALGFEDMNRSSTGADHDFNDLVMLLHVEKKQSLANVTVTKVSPESTVKSVRDIDGGTTVVHYPSATTWATLAFEDLWPEAPSGFFYDSITAKQADYDFNDLVVKYRSSQTLIENASIKRIKQIDLTYRVDARGGSNPSGFAVQLQGLKRDEIESIRVVTPDSKEHSIDVTDTAPYSMEAPAQGAYVGVQNESNSTFKTTAIDAGNNQVTIRLFNNALNLLPTKGDCNFYNTLRRCPVEESKTFTVQIKFKGLGAIQTAGLTPPYNPYIFNTDFPSKEVHLPNQPPTQFSKRNNSSFGTFQDVTDKVNWTKTYVTKDGRPWAVHIPYEWDHPAESVRIGDAFSGFKPWVESTGANNKDWYTKPTVSNTFRGARKFPK